MVDTVVAPFSVASGRFLSRTGFMTSMVDIVYVQVWPSRAARFNAAAAIEPPAPAW